MLHILLRASTITGYFDLSLLSTRRKILLETSFFPFCNSVVSLDDTLIVRTTRATLRCNFPGARRFTSRKKSRCNARRRTARESAEFTDDTLRVTYTSNLARWMHLAHAECCRSWIPRIAPIEKSHVGLPDEICPYQRLSWKKRTILWRNKVRIAIEHCSLKLRTSRYNHV